MGYFEGSRVYHRKCPRVDQVVSDKKLMNEVGGSWTERPGSLTTPESGVRLGPLTLDQGAIGCIGWRTQLYEY